jgi:hypothetical protein
MLTGIHLMRTGRVEANLLKLNAEACLPYIPDLLHRKMQGSEKGSLDAGERDFHRAEYARLMAALEKAALESHLPDEPGARDALNDLLIRVRLRPVTPR